MHAKRATWSKAYLGVLAAIILGLVAFLVAKYGYPFGSAEAVKRLAIVVSGDTAGWIVPCGCTSNQSGGLLRRATFVKSLGEDRRVLLADAGGAASWTSPYDRVKFEAILRGEQAMGCAAHNLGGSEIALGADYLREVMGRLRVPFVSTNLQDGQGATVFPDFILHQVGTRRVAFTGVVSQKFSGPGLRVHDPANALFRLISEIRSRYDILIVLAYVPEDELMQLAAAVPEADAVIGGPTGQSVAPRAVGSALVASATNKGKFLVCLEADPMQRPRPAWSGRIVELGPSYDDEPGQKQNVQNYLAELARRDFTAAETGFVPTLQHRDDFRVAGTTACQRCHSADCKQWDGSKHAQAWHTLEGKGYHVDAACQQCHTTGFGQTGGFVSARRSPERVAVGCESCHGPSAAHVKNVKLRTPFAAKDQCLRCHDHENSPQFEYDKYWQRIAHGKEPAKAQ